MKDSDEESWWAYAELYDYCSAKNTTLFVNPTPIVVCCIIIGRI